jgi:HemY protein
MIRILAFVVALALAALGLAWLADQPGSLQLEWFGYEVQTSAFVGALAVALIAGLMILIWGTFRYVLTRPGAIASHLKERRRRQGFDALTGGLLAVGTGDRSQAEQHSAAARRLLPNEPLTALLRAQTLQLTEDREGARRAFEAMLDDPKTELLGLRGLFLEAKRRNDADAARQFVEQAVKRDPGLGWSVKALFALQALAGDWDGALKTLAVARQHEHIDAKTALRQRAVLLTAAGRDLEAAEPDRALALTLEAQRLEPSLIPAAEIAGRILASKGEARRAARTVVKTWKQAAHPDLALVYAHANPGAAPKERLKRVKYLASYRPDDIESAVAVANAAIEAQAWEEARLALAPYLADRPPARVCALMARIEAGEFGDRGREREWLARTVRAPRDRAWVAGTYISDRWLPVSPATGKLDAFRWTAPVDAIGRGNETLVTGEVMPPPAPPPAGLPEIRPIADAPTAAARPASDWLATPEADKVTEPPRMETPRSADVPAPAPPPADMPKTEPPEPTSAASAREAAPPLPAEQADAPPRDKAYVPLRAPDDPGVPDDDPDEAPSDLERLRSAQAR